jgi:hypothetical protein
MNKNRRRRSPECEPLPVRAPLAQVVLYDLDTGASASMPWLQSDPKYNVPAPPGYAASYLAPEIDFRGPVPTFPGAVDYSGYGGHGSVMAELYAATVIEGGGVPVVVPCVVGNGANMDSAAIGRAELTIAATARAHPELRMVVALPAGPGFTSAAEYEGRAALASAGVPLVESAGDSASPVFPAQFGPATVVSAASRLSGRVYPYSNRGAGVVPVVIPDPALGTSGAAEVESALIALGDASPRPIAPAPVPVVHPGGIHALKKPRR